MRSRSGTNITVDTGSVTRFCFDFIMWYVCSAYLFRKQTIIFDYLQFNFYHMIVVDVAWVIDQIIDVVTL